MSPFLNEEDFDDYEEVIEAPVKKEKEPKAELSFLRNDRKFFIIGGLASMIAFASVVYFLYTNSKPVNLDDLPLVKADPTPIKVRPRSNAQVRHQDKIVYDNISGDIRGRDEEERVISQPEEVLSINEMDSDGVLSPEEKRKIINAFDDLAPADAEKEYRINYVQKENEGGQERIVEGMRIVEDDPSLPPIRRNIEPEKPVTKLPLKSKKSKRHTRIADLLGQNQRTNKRTNKRETRRENQRPPSQSQRKYTTKTHVNQWSGDGEARYNRYDGYNSNNNNRTTPARARSSGNASGGGGIMVQIGSVPTRSGAESEYRRIAGRNRSIRNYNRRIYKADLGARGSTYRIQLGPFRSNAEAQKVISNLRNSGCSAYISR